MPSEDNAPIHTLSGFPSLPSPLHISIGVTVTIQFPHGINGDKPGGFKYPATAAGHPKQIAVPNPPVNVGVANIRIKFVGLVTHSHPPAPRHTPPALKGTGGHTAGSGGIGGIAGVQVSAENIGSPSFTLSPSPIGFPNMVGSPHGASGAQFKALDRQPHQPKLHA